MSPSELSREATPVLELAGITKRFGAVVANDSVDFELHAGEIHALVGENGAGKTTLMRILYGMYRADAGEVRVDGQPAHFTKPMDSIRAGIGMVHQHFMLVPSFTVAENVTLGAEPKLGGRYSRRASAAAIADVAGRLGVRIDPEAIVGDLSVATQQKLEIMKVLYRGARVIILDEPTAVLTPSETTELFLLLRRLASDGASVVFISHKLREVFEVADRITVLRQGRTVATFEAAETDSAEVVAAMTGRSDVNLGRVERSAPAASGAVLDVSNLSTAATSHDAALEDVTFQIAPGEILGVAGVEGNGQTALTEAVIGTLTATGGEVQLSGRVITGLDVASRRDAGVGFVPEDRHREGLPMSGSVLEGIAAERVRSARASRWWLPALPGPVRTWAEELVARHSIKTSSIDAKCSQLSGGNQQKIVIARELEAAPKLLVLAQPTRGVDLGAIEFIYNQVAEATARGCAVLLISADLDEILRLSDRVIVMYDGRVAAEEVAATATRESLGMHMAGMSSEATK